MRRKIAMVLLITFPITFYYFSPYVIIEGALNNIITGSFIVFLSLFLFSMKFKRQFCSVCPIGLYQDLYGILFRKYSTKVDWVKYVIWILWLGMIAVLSRGVFTSIQFGYLTQNGISVSNVYSLIVFIIVMVIVFGLTLIFGRRGFCHSMCWIAPFMVVGSKLGKGMNLNQYDLRSNDDCISCNACNNACLMSLDVMNLKEKISSECILCGKCVDACPTECLRIGFRG